MRRERSTSERFPRPRRAAIDAGRLGRRKNVVHALVQADVTKARRALSAYERSVGTRLSFTAYVIHCVGAALRDNPRAHAYLSWRRRLVTFEHINIGTMVEVTWHGQPVPMPHVFRHVDERSYIELSHELRAVQQDPSSVAGWKYLTRFVRLPGPVRRVFAWVVMRIPQSFRAYSSPVLVTAVGMFGRGGGWGIPKPSQTLTVTVGGMAERPGIVDGEIRIREYVDLTISLDHDIVDGAPAARFIEHLLTTVEQAEAVPDVANDAD